MTNREIRGVAGQLCLVLLSLLPMYIFAGEGNTPALEEAPAEPVSELAVRRIA